MKKLFMTLLLGALYYCSAQAHIPSVVPADGPKITVSITLGHGESCRGWGLCEFDFGVSGLFGYVSDGGSGGGGGGSWILTIPRQGLQNQYPELLGYFDGKRSVTFPETYVLPDDIRAALGSPKDLIVQGNSTYPMRYENGEFMIKIPYPR